MAPYDRSASPIRIKGWVVTGHEDLHELIPERYETASTIVTSDVDLTDWDQAFPANRLLATATLDRLRHNAYCLVLDGQSYRSPRQPAPSTRRRLANKTETVHS